MTAFSVYENQTYGKRLPQPHFSVNAIPLFSLSQFSSQGM
jgi:hypothetical protein